ncbi:hypothetical protein Pyn_27654 [Prunus yedoensis var. nudiflora]|uniref:Uncharacterized protein n=1 Tax=Prunus yedoensis var. nudiflora TaxID=2094558 RepID=A0A314UEF8_PRUYE|nr:hypothetical protein Pyn_27654 [Prunus yedoensis var. nudiflora]
MWSKGIQHSMGPACACRMGQNWIQMWEVQADILGRYSNVAEVVLSDFKSVGTCLGCWGLKFKTWISDGVAVGSLHGCSCVLQVMGRFLRSENRHQCIVGCWGDAKGEAPRGGYAVLWEN